METEKTNKEVLPQDDRLSIGLTWYIPEDQRQQFRNNMLQMLLPDLIVLLSTKQIAAVLPFHHRPVKSIKGSDSSSWNQYCVIVLQEGADPKHIWQLIKNPVCNALENIGGEFLRVEVLRLQPNIDMFYPRIRSKQKLKWHLIEYVISKPETREEYYNDQYTFSGPVINQFWKIGNVQRAIGFESISSLVSNGGIPEWDLIHIVGFRPMKIPLILWNLFLFRSHFNNTAKKAGYKSAMAVYRSWGLKRVKYLCPAVQDNSFTLNWDV